MNNKQKMYGEPCNPDRKKHSLQKDKYFSEDTRIRYFRWKFLNMRCEPVNDKILKNVINIRCDPQYPRWQLTVNPQIHLEY